MRYVQYGCGLCAPDQWVNYDASPTIKVQKMPVIGSVIKKAFGHSVEFPSNVLHGDIIKGLPEQDNSCDAVFCSHTLEHLSLGDLRTALRNTHKILKKGGVFRLVLPDLEYEARQYIAGLDNNRDDASHHFMASTMLGAHHRSKGVKSILMNHYGNSNHLWMWDYLSLSKELKDAGFSSVRRSQFNDNKDEMFTYVESEGRYTNCLGIEAIK